MNVGYVNLAVEFLTSMTSFAFIMATIVTGLAMLGLLWWVMAWLEKEDGE